MKLLVSLSLLLALSSPTIAQTERDVMAPKTFFVQGSVFEGVNYVRTYSSLGKEQNLSYGVVGVGVGLGNAWYQPREGNYMPGIQVTWLRTEFAFPHNDPNQPYLFLQPLQVGFSNLWKLKKNAGIQLDLNLGYVLQATNRNSPSGLQIHPELKIKTQKVQLGLGYVYTYAKPVVGEQNLYNDMDNNNALVHGENDLIQVIPHQVKLTLGLWK